MGIAIGVDIGGTKTQFAGAQTWTVPSDGWAQALRGDPGEWISARVTDYLTRLGMDWADVDAVCVGAHGLENAESLTMVQRGLVGGAAWPAVRWRVVNDAQLVVPAAGLERGIGVICGTGSIVVGADATGVPMRAGGWGWLLGDDGSGSALVREALKRVLSRHDDGRRPSELGRLLLGAIDLDDPFELGIELSFGRGPSAWAGLAPLVFQAADAGDDDALTVICEGGIALARLVGTLVRRGAVGRNVVVAGSVIVHQKRLLEAFRTELSTCCPGLGVQVLRVDPVQGALALAETLQDGQRSAQS